MEGRIERKETKVTKRTKEETEANKIAAKTKIHKKAYQEIAILAVFAQIGFNTCLTKTKRNSEGSTAMRIQEISTNEYILFRSTPYFLSRAKNHKGKKHINTEVAKELKLLINSLNVMGFGTILKPMKGHDYDPKPNRNYKHPIITKLIFGNKEWTDKDLVEIGEDIWNVVIQNLNNSAKVDFILTPNHFINQPFSTKTLQFLIDIGEILQTIDPNIYQYIISTNWFWMDESTSNTYSSMFTIEETESNDGNSIVDGNDDLGLERYRKIFDNIKKYFEMM